MPHPKIQPLGDAQFIRMALVGASGFGKTVFAGTAPKALFLTTDPEGTASAKQFGSTAMEWRCSSATDLDEAWTYLDTGGIEADGLEWVIVDNISEAQRFYMDWGLDTMMELARKKNETANPYIPSQREYLIEQNGVLDFCRRMNQLPVNILYTAHRVGREDGDANAYFSIYIRGKKGEIAQSVLGYTNIIGMGEVMEIGDKKIVRRLYFDHVREYRGKDRFNKLGRYRDDLTVPAMMEILGRSGAPAEVKTTPTERSRPRPRPRS